MLKTFCLIFPDDKDLYSNEKIDELNANWVAGIDEDQGIFLNSMINMYKTVPINPNIFKETVDVTYYCWTILAYNSDFIESRDGMC